MGVRVGVGVRVGMGVGVGESESDIVRVTVMNSGGSDTVIMKRASIKQ